MKKFFCLALAALTALAASAAAEGDAPDSLSRVLAEVSVSAIKDGERALRPVASTIVTRREAERLGVMTMKQVSEIAPNFYIPDYGTRMTSSIYVRGIGARIDQPVVGLNIDNVPFLNKDNYDFDLVDIDRIEVIRGPQCTLYGRNTMGGVVNISTLSPLRYRGLRLMAEGGTGGTARLSLSAYRPLSRSLGMSLSGQMNYRRGWFRNSLSGARADREEGGSLRWKTAWRPSETFTLENTASWSHSRQHGYPYASAVTGLIATNDTCYYRRTGVTDGLTATWHTGPLTVSSITSFQYIKDDMTIDQDFLPLSYFTLTQARHEWALTQDVVVKGSAAAGRYQWLAGAFVFGKRTNMRAPVTFKEHGIAELIEGKRNEINPQYPVRWDDDVFPLRSSFRMPVWGIALYHRSTLNLGAWTLMADLRLDHEHTSLSYVSDCRSSYTIYDMTDPMLPQVFGHRDVVIDNIGRMSKTFLQLLPKLTVERRLGTHGSRVYASVAKGYKAGGYNTQMFSDVLQQLVMQSMGVTAKYDIADIVGYDPEKSWNYEIGASYRSPGGTLALDAAAFWIDCRDQQLTMFPEGTTTGRIMANAGKTRSAGIELNGCWRFFPGWTLSGAYGFTDARFVDFSNGRERYDGCRAPYAPANTLFASVAYTRRLGHGPLRLTVDIDLRGVGDIYWDEANTRRQPFYALLGATAALESHRWSLTLWGENLTATHYNTFSYVSIGNTFYQAGLPARGGLTLRLAIL